jgi:hypothetical protein
MGIFIFNDSVVFHKLTCLKIINLVLKGLQEKFPISVLPNYSNEKDFYRYKFKQPISDELLTQTYSYLSKYNKNA